MLFSNADISPDDKAHVLKVFGIDFDEKILPSITNEVLKGVVVHLL